MENNMNQIASLMAKEPYKRYIKATLGRVVVKILDPITGQQVEVVLSGDPKLKEESCILDLWTSTEQTYFERNNKQILGDGLLVDFKESIEAVPTANNVSDAQIIEALTGKFFQVKKLLDGFTATAPVERMLTLAEEMNRPVKTIDAIKGKLAELQQLEYER
jgi:hypothetical protein